MRSFITYGRFLERSGNCVGLVSVLSSHRVAAADAQAVTPAAAVDDGFLS